MRRLSCALLLLCLVGARPAAAAEDVTLAWTFKEGETLLLSLEGRSETVELKRQGDAPMPHRQEKSSRQFATYELRVLEAPTEGAAHLSLQLRDLLLVMVSERVTVRIDARTDGERVSLAASMPSARKDRREDVAELLDRLVRGMMACRYRVRVSRRGDLGEVEVVGDPFAGLQGIRRRRLKATAKALRALFDPQAMARAALSQVFMPLPAAGVREGATWSTSRSLDALGMTLKSEGTASLVKVEGNGETQTATLRGESRHVVDTSRFAEAYGRTLAGMGLDAEVTADVRSPKPATMTLEARFAPSRGRIERLTWDTMDARFEGTLTVTSRGRTESVELAVHKRGTQSLSLVSLDQIRGFARALRSATPQARAEAAAALARVGPAAASAEPALLRALSDEDTGVRRHAARALGAARVGSAEALAALVAALEDADAEVRAEAAHALACQGAAAEPHAPALVAAARSGRVPAAAEALKDLCGHVGQAVLAAYSDDAEARSEAKYAIGRHAPAHAGIAVPAMLHMIEVDRRTEKPSWTAESMLETLAKFGAEARAVAPLLPAYLSSEHERTRAKALELCKAIVQVGEPSLDALRQRLKLESDPFQRSDVADTLGRVRPVQAKTITALIEALGDESHYVRSSSAWALGQLGRDAAPAVSALQAATKDSDERVRMWAISALGSIGPDAKTAIPAVIANLDHERYMVRLYAIQALPAFGPLASEAVPKLLEIHARRARGPAVQETSLQTWAAVALHQIEPEGARTIPALRASLTGRARAISAEAALVLGRYGEKAHAAIPAITKLLDDDDIVHQRRDAALKALAEFGPAARGALPRIRQFLGMKDGDGGVWVARALYRIDGSTEGIALLKARLDTSAWTPALAAQVLAEMGPEAKAAVPDLIEVLARKSASNAAAAAAALARIEDTSAPVLDALRTMMRRPEARARIAAAHALFQLESQAAVALPVLMAELEGEESVRGRAAHALGEMGRAAAPALARLKRMSKDDDRLHLREMAADAVQRIQGAGKR